MNRSQTRRNALVLATLLAVSLTVGLTAISGVAAADEPYCSGITYEEAGTSSDPYHVDTVEELQCIGTDIDGDGDVSDDLEMAYELTSDINASETATWNDGKGFNPIASGTYGFDGTFDGNGHTISGLTIDRDGFAGLFSQILAGEVTSVGLIGGSVTSNTGSAGGLATTNEGNITNSFASIDVTGAAETGGLVGVNIGNGPYGTVKNSYSTGRVVSTANTAGGLVGRNGLLFDDPDDPNSRVFRSYAVGAVEGDTSNVGGLVGYVNINAARIEYSYADSGTTNQVDAVGRDGVQTVDVQAFGDSGDTEPAPEMLGSSAETNMNLDFDTTWETVESGDADTRTDGYPILRAVDRVAQLRAQGVYDTPVVSSITRESPASQQTNADSVAFAVAFSKSVTGVDAGDFTLSTTGSARTADGDTDISVAGSGSSYTVTVDNVEGTGDLRVDLDDDDSITDGNNVPLGGSGTAGGADGSYTSGEAFTVDTTRPTVASITRSAPAGSETNADSVGFEVAFSESVTGVSPDDFSPSGGASGTVDATSSASGSTIIVTVTGVSEDGSLGLDLASGGDIADSVGNSLDTTEPGTDETYTVDNTAPRVTGVTLADDTDGDGVLTDGDTIEVTATVTDARTISTVEADANGFDAGIVTLDDDGPNSSAADDRYSATFIVGSVPTDGDQSVTVSATDSVGNGGSQAVGSTSVTVDSTEPSVTGVTLTDDTDRNGVLTDGDTVGLTVTVTDASPITTVDADASVFDAGTVTLNDDGPNSSAADDRYSATLTVGADPIDGAQSVTVNATDTLGNGGSQAIGSGTLTVDTTNPSFESSGTRTVLENTALAVDVNATDGDGNDTDITYSLVGGADQSAFSIDAATGNLSFDSPPNFENATDADGDNEYVVDVQATDDIALTTIQTIAVAVADVDEPPLAPDNSSQTTDEETPLSVSDNESIDLLELASDPDAGDSLSLSAINGTSFSDGTPQTLGSGANVTVYSSGNWTYDPNGRFESLDAGQNTTDNFSYTVSDADGDTARGTITITVTGVDEPTPRRSRSSSSSSSSSSSDDLDVRVTASDSGTDGAWRVDISDPPTDEPVEIPLADDTIASEDERDISLTALQMNLNQGSDFELDIATGDTESDGTEQSFRTATGSESIETITVDHTVADEDIQDVTFTVTLEKSRLAESGLDSESVALYRDETTQWNRLPTTVVGETDSQYSFEATSPGLSTFVIGAAPAAADQPAASNDSTAADEPATTDDETPGFGVGAGGLAILASGFVARLVGRRAD